jgi:NADPH:quinone reductase-like Zn-dependent oxidoreductase
VKTIWLPRHGRPEIFVDRDADPPPAGSGGLVVRVRAAGVNFADILQRLGFYASAPRPPYVMGFEVAGDVVEVGAGVRGFSVGDRAVGMLSGGGYAEMARLDARAAVRIPDGLSYVQAAAVPVNYLTAWFCLFDMGHLVSGEKVLIQSGAGGVGTAAIQLAREAGAVVFATAGSAHKVAFLKQAGVDHAIDYNATRFDEEVRKVAGERSLDLVLDAVGGDTLRRGYDLLAPLGRVVSYGLSDAVAGPRRGLPRAVLAWLKTPRFNPLSLIGRNVGVWGFHLALLHGREARIAAAMGEIMTRIASGRLAPVIARTFPLDASGAAAAHHFIHERRNIGKVLLAPSSPD